MLEKLTRAACEELRNGEFTLHVDNAHSIPVRLTAVRGSGPTPLAPGGREPFALEFKGPPNMPVLPQRNALGCFEKYERYFLRIDRMKDSLCVDSPTQLI